MEKLHVSHQCGYIQKFRLFYLIIVTIKQIGKSNFYSLQIIEPKMCFYIIRMKKKKKLCII
jgi:hypothetical protein